MNAEQRDAPFVVVKACRTRDVLSDAAGELATAGTVFMHQFAASLVRECEPVGVDVATLAHRVEAPGRHGVVDVIRRDGGIEARLLHLIRHLRGVFADLAEADVRVDDIETGVLHCGLQGSQFAHVLVDGHHGEIAFVAEHRNGHDLASGGFGRFDPGHCRLGIEQRRRLAEQVQHTDSDGRRNGVALHVLRLERHPLGRMQIAAPTMIHPVDRGE